MKSSNETLGNRTRVLPTCSAVVNKVAINKCTKKTKPEQTSTGKKKDTENK